MNINDGENKELDQANVDYKISIDLPLNKGRIILEVDIQNDDTPGYNLMYRALYYASKMITIQKGKEFNQSNYDCLKKVYSIWILPQSKKEYDGLITATTHHTEVLNRKDIHVNSIDK